MCAKLWRKNMDFEIVDMQNHIRVPAPKGKRYYNYVLIANGRYDEAAGFDFDDMVCWRYVKRGGGM